MRVNHKKNGRSFRVTGSYTTKNDGHPYLPISCHYKYNIMNIAFAIPFGLMHENS